MARYAAGVGQNKHTVEARDLLETQGKLFKGPNQDQKPVESGPRSVKPVGHIPDTSGERRQASEQNHFIRQKSEIFAAYHEDPYGRSERQTGREPEPECNKPSLQTHGSK